MKRMSVIILSLFISAPSISWSKSAASSNVAAIASICKEASKYSNLKDTPAKDLLTGIWAALTWWDSAEPFALKTRAAFKSRSPRAWLQMAHAASVGSYMLLSLAKSYKKYKSNGDDAQAPIIKDLETTEEPNQEKQTVDPADLVNEQKGLEEDEFKKTDLAANVCATGCVLLASTKHHNVTGNLNDMMTGTAYSLMVYPDVEYVGKYMSNAWRDKKPSIDSVHSLSAAAFMGTTLLTTYLKYFGSHSRNDIPAA